MRFWRICRLRFAAAAATGEGARLYGGRWNSPGVSVVYASTSLALAAVETFVNIEPNLQPDDLVSVAGDLPDDLNTDRIDLKALRRDWHSRRDHSLCHFGDNWIREGKTVALLVPSAAIRNDWNVLLNPAHCDFQKVRFEAPVPFQFDARMFRGH